MPQRQYFYTPIVFENHNIGEKTVNGEYVASTACAPGANDPGNPMETLSVFGEGMICLRVDISQNRCVMSIPQDTNEVIIDGNTVGVVTLGEWQQVNRAQIESEYQNSDASADDAIIDFTVEGE
tara:strand:- start:1204 stop:1575 length:372 start_codon:yes stop_codon:yes gene_type:complete